MGYSKRVSTGIPGFDQAIDMLRLGDNVVWQVKSADDYAKVVTPFVEQAIRDDRKLVYIRFGQHIPMVKEDVASEIIYLDPSIGFERFAATVHEIITREGKRAFYVFDSMTDLLESWHSDLMVGNFFRVTCPYLFQLETVAYFALFRGVHTYNTIARVRETTQLLLDMYTVEGEVYIHPLKVWERYSPTMFFPHLIRGEEAISITASTQSAKLFALQEWGYQSQNQWERFLQECRRALSQSPAAQEAAKRKLIYLLMAKEGRMAELCNRYFTLYDLLATADHEVSTGMIGGKSVGMLLARKILAKEWGEEKCAFLEPHDSYYLGSDIFYTYIVHNDWWDLHIQQKTEEGYFEKAAELREHLRSGQFPANIQEQFMEMLEHFGQSPIIVRSSSLQEDNFGNAFAGKYESVFCTNQGTPEDRYQAFEEAVRIVYASTMSVDALHYRLDRNLLHSDEQMAILVQRVSGDHYGQWFFPHMAGVGNSHNLYVWDGDLDPEAGMLRLVYGLGTRAVDRVSGDYARLVSLDKPMKLPPAAGSAKKYVQHWADVLDLLHNEPAEIPFEEFSKLDLRTDKTLFFTVDEEAIRFLREMGRTPTTTPWTPDFKKLLATTDFAQKISKILKTLERVYEYPVDIEFTANFTPQGTYYLNLLQCRPLQTHNIGQAVAIPTPKEQNVLFQFTGNFMGGNVKLNFDYVIFIKAEEYIRLSQSQQYEVARTVGDLNQILKGKKVLLIGPGRWGTSTPSLGIPVHFTEINHMTAVCEYSYNAGGIIPDLSFGSHFFQDIVESNIFYAAVFGDKEGVTFRPQLILQQENGLASLEENTKLSHVIHLAVLPACTLYSDIRSQKILCYLEEEQ